MADEPARVPPGSDPQRANVARVYDYLLGGSHNFLADQDLGRAMAAVDPNIRAIARANRAFLGRAVRFLAGAGIRQFLDIGSGIPTQGNVHEVAHQADPGARVVYADLDPVAIAHSTAILADNDNAAIIEGDLRESAKILAHPASRQLIDFSQPAGLLLVAVLHFISDAEDPWRIVATLREALAPGSYLVLCHATNESGPPWRGPRKRCTSAASPPRGAPGHAQRSSGSSRVSTSWSRGWFMSRDGGRIHPATCPATPASSGSWPGWRESQADEPAPGRHPARRRPAGPPRRAAARHRSPLPGPGQTASRGGDRIIAPTGRDRPPGSGRHQPCTQSLPEPRVHAQ